MSDLDSRLLAAHAAGEKHSLVILYKEAATAAKTSEAQGFFLTHAYVYALETDHPMAAELHKRLKATGREA